MGGPGGSFGGGGGTADSQLVAYLEAHQGSAKYLVAATGSQATDGIIMATGEPVITIGGFTGSDPAPTVAQLADLVAKGEVRYVLVSGQGGGPGGGNSEITSWVQEHGTAVTGAGTTGGTLYRVSA
jgi:4-amino-4-deoxy-L-arabinose transferase-like glycosyltransferase